jgi:hypothetical protein
VRAGATVVALALVACAAQAAEFQRLRGREIGARLSGMEMTDRVHWGLLFHKDGRLTAAELGGRITAVPKGEGSGTWRVRGDEVCLDLAGAGPRCSQVWSAGASVQLRRDGEPSQDGTLQRPGR